MVCLRFALPVISTEQSLWSICHCFSDLCSPLLYICGYLSFFWKTCHRSMRNESIYSATYILNINIFQSNQTYNVNVYILHTRIIAFNMFNPKQRRKKRMWVITDTFAKVTTKSLTEHDAWFTLATFIARASPGKIYISTSGIKYIENLKRILEKIQNMNTKIANTWYFKDKCFLW